MTALAMILALGLEAAVGWPDRLYARIGHPVTWIGRLISALDRRWNREAVPERARRGLGLLAVIVVVGLTVGVTAALEAVLPGGLAGVLLLAVLAWPLLAARSLWDHVAAVAGPLALGDIAGARAEVAKIVGRDPERLDAEGIARAALESLAENSSDGVVAPFFWGVLLGLPGIAAYKAINTLDSMIGYRTPRHLAFGWAAARLDDVVNWVPARLTALAYAVASGRPGAVWPVVRSDARHHRSPNAGWPEAALAGALGVRLAGPRAYAAGLEDLAWVNGACPDPGAEDIRRGLTLYLRMILLVAVVAAVLGIGV